MFLTQYHATNCVDLCRVAFAFDLCPGTEEQAKEDLKYLTGSIIGAAFEVSNTLGHGFLEAVYRKALLHELTVIGLSVQQEVPFDIRYKDINLGRYRCDILVEGAVIVEVKAIDRLTASHVGQLLNYLKAAGLKVGLLLNFGRPRLGYQRVVL